jgi:methylaspartate mutase sigma subunit
MPHGASLWYAQNQPQVLVASTPSDAHSWNLVFLQLLLEESHHAVTNLGPCLPVETLVDECLARRPELVVVSSVNGHGHHDGPRIIAALRAEPALAATRVVIGGMLTTDAERDQALAADLRARGYDEVFVGAHAVEEFQNYLKRRPVAAGTDAA